MKILCIIQARMGSSRLPGKILAEIAGRPLLAHVLERVGKARLVNKIIVATTTNREDDKTEDFCRKEGFNFFRGSPEDVLSRYNEAASLFPSFPAIMRVTGDCPLIDPAVIDDVSRLFIKEGVDYASNIEKETYPDGMDVEIFRRTALEKANLEATLFSDREHVTPYIRKSPFFKKANLSAPKNMSNYRFTVDNFEDLEMIRLVLEKAGTGLGYADYVAFLDKNLKIKKLNAHIKRNEGYKASLKADKIKK